MNPSSPDQTPPIPPQELPSKEDRLKLIFKILDEKPAAKDAEEANLLVQEVFREVERDIPYVMDKMSVYDLEYLQKIPYKGKTIYFQTYIRHTIFISENGAIEIRANGDHLFTDMALQRDPLPVIKDMGLVFQKPGADGHTVWD